MSSGCAVADRAACTGGREEGTFDIHTVIQSVTDKMIRRHPHVFGSGMEADTSEEDRGELAGIKAQEKADQGGSSRRVRAR